jgi:hypothetical protein
METGSLAALRGLKLYDETWQIARRRMRLWITPPDKEPERPYIILCQSLDGPVLVSNIQPGNPSPEEMLAALATAMRRPPEGAGPPRRPTLVELEEAELVEALAPALDLLDIGCEQAPLDFLEATLLDLETHLRGREPIPGLLALPGTTPEGVGAFFSAAAFYYREAPWRWLSDSEPLAVRCPPTAQPRYAVIMGNAGIEYGLAVYDSWTALQDVYRGGRPRLSGPGARWWAVMYDELTNLPFDDLDGLEAHGWEVAGEQAYPIPAVLSAKKALERPGAQELAWLEALLRALPPFVRDHLRTPGGGLRPAQATLEVPAASGEMAVQLQFPAPPPRPGGGRAGRRRRI